MLIASRHFAKKYLKLRFITFEIQFQRIILQNMCVSFFFGGGGQYIPISIKRKGDKFMLSKK